MKNTLLIHNVSHVVTCDASDRVLNDVSLFVSDGVIREICEEARLPGLLKRWGIDDLAEVPCIDGTGCALYPGLVNTHHHFYQIFSRNLPEVQNLELFPWLKALYQLWKNLNAEVVYHASLCGMGELLKCGCTTTADHHYVYPHGCGMDLMDSQFAAADLLGIRFHATRGSMDLSEKDGGLPPDSVVQTIDGIMRDCEDAVRKYHDGAVYSMHRVALAPCSPFSVSKTLLSESARLARRLGVRLHTHLAETRDEERYMLEKAGVRPLEYMAQLGWVGEDVWYAHGIWFNDGELALLAETGTGVAHCPVSNMKLSSGVARVPEMVARGIPVGLAVDGSASNDGSNLLEEMRACYLLHRLNSGSKALSGYDVLKLATRGGARLLGRNDIGWIGEGSAADFFLVDLNRPELVGAQFDPAGMLATVGLKGPVDYTVVNGKTVVEKGRLTGVDEKQLSQRANAVCRRYLAR